MPAQLWIVSGPSSAGKSHFLAGRSASEVAGLSPDAPVVLALNVLRRVPEPVTALTRLSALARERLVLEFPTLEDRKFRAE